MPTLAARRTSMRSDNTAQLRHALLGRLENLQLAGVLQIPKESATIRMAGKRDLASSDVSVADPTSPSTKVASSQPDSIRKKTSHGGRPATSLFEAVETSGKTVAADL